MNRAQKIQIIQILASAILLALALTLPLSGVPHIALFICAYLAAGITTLHKAIVNIFHGQVFDENFLMSIASVGALFLGDYSEAVVVMLFYMIGTLFESYAVNRSRKSIAALMDIRPEYANLLKDGHECEVDPYEVAVGNTIIVKPGEKVPLDGVVLEGSSALDTSALTGESLPREVSCGDEILSGCIDLSGLLKVRVTKEYDDSTVARILELVENAGSRKAPMENFITRFARYYTPAVVICAAALAVIPPLAFAGQTFDDWIYRALVFLVISCPCALVISVPLSFFGGIGAASRCGILVKGSNYLEALAHAETMIFDKTGTLTDGTFSITHICASGCSEDELLELAAYGEHYSNHPVSLPIKEAFGRPVDETLIESVQEIAGKGMRVRVFGRDICIGNSGLMAEAGIKDLPADETSTLMHIAADGVYCGYIALSDTLKPGIPQAIEAIKATGVKNTVMLTGDRRPIAEKVAAATGIDNLHSELLPADKVAITEEFLEQSREKGGKGKVVFVGDGINDAPVLAGVDIGIAMGGLGSQAAIEAADMVIMDDDPSKIPLLMRISRKTLAIAKENVIFALGVKAVILALGAVGLASMWAAVFADVGVSIIAIINALRALMSRQ